MDASTSTTVSSITIQQPRSADGATLGKYESLPDQYKTVIHNKHKLNTTDTQINRPSNKFNLRVFHEKSANLRWTMWDLNPRHPECKSKSPANTQLNDSIDWNGFRDWLLTTHSQGYANDLYRLAQKYCEILWVPNKSRLLHHLSNGNRRLAMAALSNLSKYLGIYKVWKEIIENSGLKWSSGQSGKLLLERFTRVQDPDELSKWFMEVNDIIPAIQPFMHLVAFTGIRFVEAVEAYNLIINLSRKDVLNEYYDGDRKVLNHHKFTEQFMRRSKKVFISFASEDLIHQIAKSKPITQYVIINRLTRVKINRKFGELREYWATKMTETLRQAEIDFLQGRISTNVFMQHYFNPAWIADLQTRTVNTTEKLLSRLAS